MKRLPCSDHAALPGFQIAPMIDVVFVIMLFFMVMAAQVRKEAEISLRLPKGAMLVGGDVFPDEELLLAVGADGIVTMNGEPFDTPASHEMPGLTRALKRIQHAVSAQRSKVLATIQAEPQAGYQRVMDVLNALHAAAIPHVTFEVDGS